MFYVYEMAHYTFSTDIEWVTTKVYVVYMYIVLERKIFIHFGEGYCV